MNGAWWTKFGIFLAGTILAVTSLLPSYQVATGVKDPATWPESVKSISARLGDPLITPGLDLQGGLHVQYQVDVDKAISDKVDRYVDEAKRAIAKDHPEAQATVVRVEGAQAFRISANSDPIALLSENTLVTMNLLPVNEGNNTVRFEVDSAYVEQVKDSAIETAMATIERRINELGLGEQSISRRGNSDIIVQLPGLSDEQFERTKDLISQTAVLEFQMLAPADATAFASVTVPAGSTEIVRDASGRPRSMNIDALRTLLTSVTPPAGTEISFEAVTQPVAGQAETVLVGYIPRLVESSVDLTGEYITDARVTQDPTTGRPAVSLTFDSVGAEIFGRLTTENVNRQMGIVLDGIIKSAPNINEPILGGSAQITVGSGGTYQDAFNEATELAIVLRNGALPAPIEKQFETQVGPSLGQESIDAGKMALGAAFVIVFLFMAAWYRVSGVLSGIALAFNILFIFSTMAFLGATLTLPGIAGIILTIGMAVDANVIVFERIRDELRLGKGFKQALNAGYDKAFTAILDGNLTTAIAGLVLMSVGSGPVKGFAVTLLIGIVWTLVTALSLVRVMFDFLVDGAKLSKVSI